MSEFEELDIPKKANLGWYVVTMWGFVSYLHNDGQIHDGTQNQYFLSTGYFETELEAHKCAERYYITHCRKYPYSAELNKSSQVMNHHSQVMNFLG